MYAFLVAVIVTILLVMLARAKRQKDDGTKQKKEDDEGGDWASWWGNITNKSRIISIVPFALVFALFPTQALTVIREYTAVFIAIMVCIFAITILPDPAKWIQWVKRISWVVLVILLSRYIFLPAAFGAFSKQENLPSFDTVQCSRDIVNGKADTCKSGKGKFEAGSTVQIYPGWEKPVKISALEFGDGKPRMGISNIGKTKPQAWIPVENLKKQKELADAEKRARAEAKKRRKEEEGGSRIGKNWTEVSWDTLMVGRTFVSTGFSKPGVYRIKTRERPNLQIRFGKTTKGLELAQTSAGFWSGRVEIEYNTDGQVLEIASKGKPIRIIKRRL